MMKIIKYLIHIEIKFSFSQRVHTRIYENQINCTDLLYIPATLNICVHFFDSPPRNTSNSGSATFCYISEAKI